MLNHSHFLSIANIVASASYCKRRKVGAVLVKDGRIIGTGYNGTPAKTDNDCECDGITKQSVIHAEINCVLNATREDLTGSTMYVTLSPCLHCAAVMKQKGISCVVFQEAYRDMTGVEWLKENKVDVICI